VQEARPDRGAGERLGRARSGDALAAEELLTLLYRELRGLASRMMADERASHTLQTTALVHEAWLRLFGSEPAPSEDRRHYLRLAARAMRQVLIDHARRRAADKRGGAPAALELGRDVAAPWTAESSELLALDDALTRLDGQDGESARVVELRFFAGLTLEETASVLGLTPRQVEGRWNFARGWLRRELLRGAERDG